jgi:hypothetical protein
VAVRNFWVSADIDGRATELAGGPRNKNGGMTICLYMREDGCIGFGGKPVVKLECRANDNLLTLRIKDEYGNTKDEIITRR